MGQQNDTDDLTTIVSQNTGPKVQVKPTKISTAKTEQYNSLAIFDSSIDYHNVRCTICGLIKFTGTRFFCVTCKQNLCGSCFQHRKQSPVHQVDHLTVYIPMPLNKKGQTRLTVLVGIINRNKAPIFQNYNQQTQACSRCGSQKGVRVKCDQCKQLVFCLECYLVGKKGHDKKHRFVIVQSIRIILNIGFLQKRLFRKQQYQLGVKKVKHKKGGQTFALKTIQANLMQDWGQQRCKSFQNQKKAYFQLRSSNIIACFGCMKKKIDEKKFTMYLLLQWCQRGSLADLIAKHQDYPKISYRRRMGIVKTMVSGLRLIHEKGFVHKDMKPDNILLDRYLEVKIGDLGIAVQYVQNKQMYSMAHKQYAAPQLRGETKSIYTNKVDIYSLGLVINYIFTGKKHKFKTQKKKVLVQFIEESQFFYDIIQRCVQYSADLRPSALKMQVFFNKFDQYFWDQIRQSYEIKKYQMMPTLKKNQIFRNIYNNFYKQNKFQAQ